MDTGKAREEGVSCGDALTTLLGDGGEDQSEDMGTGGEGEGDQEVSPPRPAAERRERVESAERDEDNESWQELVEPPLDLGVSEGRLGVSEGEGGGGREAGVCEGSKT